MDFIIRPYRQGEEKYVAEAHRRIYTKEYRWGDSFTEYAINVALHFAESGHSERGELWVAETDGKLVGCIMLCQTDKPLTGQLRLLLVENEYRCLGVGKALINTLLARAKNVGYKELILWTASPLKDAIRHYEKLGFRRVEEIENNKWSLDGKCLSEIKMQLTIQ